MKKGRLPVFSGLGQSGEAEIEIHEPQAVAHLLLKSEKRGSYFFSVEIFVKQFQFLSPQKELCGGAFPGRKVSFGPKSYLFRKVLPIILFYYSGIKIKLQLTKSTGFGFLSVFSVGFPHVFPAYLSAGEARIRKRDSLFFARTTMLKKYKTVPDRHTRAHLLKMHVRRKMSTPASKHRLRTGERKKYDKGRFIPLYPRFLGRTPFPRENVLGGGTAFAPAGEISKRQMLFCDSGR